MRPGQSSASSNPRPAQHQHGLRPRKDALRRVAGSRIQKPERSIPVASQTVTGSRIAKHEHQTSRDRLVKSIFSKPELASGEPSDLRIRGRVLYNSWRKCDSKIQVTLAEAKEKQGEVRAPPLQTPLEHVIRQLGKLHRSHVDSLTSRTLKSRVGVAAVRDLDQMLARPSINATASAASLAIPEAFLEAWETAFKTCTSELRGLVEEFQAKEAALQGTILKLEHDRDLIDRQLGAAVKKVTLGGHGLHTKR